MKKAVIILFVIISAQTFAQVHKHAIGLRGGGGGFYGFGPEISYQLGLNEKNRIEMDLGWYQRNHWNNGKGWGSGYAYRIMSFSAVYQWVWNLSGGLNWYAGPGAQVIFYDEKYYNDDDGIFMAVGGLHHCGGAALRLARDIGGDFIPAFGQ